MNSLKVLKNGGSIISLPTPYFSKNVLKLSKEKNINLSFLMVQSNGEDMNTLKNMLANNEIKPYISKTFSFENMGNAHLELESGRTIGKIIVTV